MPEGGSTGSRFDSGEGASTGSMLCVIHGLIGRRSVGSTMLFHQGGRVPSGEKGAGVGPITGVLGGGGGDVGGIEGTVLANESSTGLEIAARCSLSGPVADSVLAQVAGTTGENAMRSVGDPRLTQAAEATGENAMRSVGELTPLGVASTVAASSTELDTVAK